jgi:acyl-CoA thioester hydrolase
MPAVYRYEHTVEEGEIDGQGHVNNLEYLKWMQAAAIAHSDAQGWPASRYRAVGAGWVVRSHTIEYRQPAFAGEQIEVVTWVANFRKVRSLRKYKIVRCSDDRVLAVAATDWTFIGLERWLPRRVPAELVAAFELVASTEEP